MARTDRGVYRVVRAGWVWRVGIPGSTYPARRARNPANMTAERAPEVLQGLEWVVMCSRVGACPSTHPAGPVRHPCLPWYWDPLNAASGPIRARFSLIYCKVSQKGRVSP